MEDTVVLDVPVLPDAAFIRGVVEVVNANPLEYWEDVHSRTFSRAPVSQFGFLLCSTFDEIGAPRSQLLRDRRFNVFRLKKELVTKSVGKFSAVGSAPCARFKFEAEFYPLCPFRAKVKQRSSTSRPSDERCQL